ncbi:hypothetical protein ROHU_022167 [Labeo rohita]|uniref:Uncharacterized protein n=1 Tax=Labeo rohita TaxID=84645 RepID=A0A498MSB7_LABRO|nr:hypothetical protein ROHU_022167 [Labeo rohita]
MCASDIPYRASHSPHDQSKEFGHVRKTKNRRALRTSRVRHKRFGVRFKDRGHPEFAAQQQFRVAENLAIYGFVARLYLSVTGWIFRFLDWNTSENPDKMVFVAVEITGPSSNSTTHEDDVPLSCSIRNEGFTVPCMSSSDVEACIKMFESHPGPLLFRNGKIIRQSEITNWNEFQLTGEQVCWIKLKRGNKIKSCHGVYLGNDYTLTACHTFEYSRLYDAYVFFPTTDFVLIYEAELPKEQNMFHDKDQCLVKLLGQTDVLGKGLLDCICAPSKNEDLYFYTFDSQGNLQMHTCKDIAYFSGMNGKSPKNELLMSTADPGKGTLTARSYLPCLPFLTD